MKYFVFLIKILPIFTCLGLLLLQFSYINSFVEKKMVIVIPSYNNKNWYKRNLESVFSQKYDNYHVIYIDDCSSDNTANLVESFLKEKKKLDRVTLIKNQKRVGALANHYRAVHLCDDRDIILQLDGDDWFPNEDVLSYINNTYQDPNIWITYGQFKRWPSGKIGYCKAIPSDVITNSTLRNTSWTPGQLRTFYAWLFKQIKLEDMIFDGSAYPEIQGKFYVTNCDPVCYLPMIEMAAERHKFIQDVIYIYNQETPINDSKVHMDLLAYSGHLIRSKKPYRRLEAPIIDRVKQLENRKVNLFCCVQNYCKFEDLVVSARSLISDFKTIVFLEYAHGKWITHSFSDNTEKSVIHYSQEVVLSDILRAYSDLFSEEYWLLCENQSFSCFPMNIKRLIADLEESFAHVLILPGLPLDLDKITVPFIELGSENIAFRVDFGRAIFDELNLNSLILVRKNVFQDSSVGFHFNSWGSLYEFIVSSLFDKQVVLCRKGQPLEVAVGLT